MTTHKRNAFGDGAAGDDDRRGAALMFTSACDSSKPAATVPRRRVDCPYRTRPRSRPRAPSVTSETAPQSREPAAKVEWNRDYSPYANRKYPTHVYFGDTHHHTANSGDAFMNGDRLGPEDSYRFARGEQVTSSSGVPVKLSRPLDFLVVSDHAEGLGVMYEVYKGNPASGDRPANEALAGDAAKGGERGPESDE